MKLYENFYNDGTLTNFYGGKTDSGYKLKINKNKMTETKLTAVEFILNLDLGLDEQGKEFRVKEALSVNEIRKAKEMEKLTMINTLVEFSKGHFDIHTEEAISYITNKAEQYYNTTFKSE